MDGQMDGETDGRGATLIAASAQQTNKQS